MAQGSLPKRFGGCHSETFPVLRPLRLETGVPEQFPTHLFGGKFSILRTLRYTFHCLHRRESTKFAPWGISAPQTGFPRTLCGGLQSCLEKMGCPVLKSTCRFLLIFSITQYV